MKKKIMPTIAVAIIALALSGCHTTQNLVRRSVGVVTLPDQVKIRGDYVTPAVPLHASMAPNEHPVSRALFLDPVGDLLCVQFSGDDFGKARDKVVPFGSFEGKWLFDHDPGKEECPELSSWDAKRKTKDAKRRRLDRSMWIEVRRNLGYLSTTDLGILVANFWPNRRPPEVQDEIDSRERPRALPPAHPPVEHVSPAGLLPEGSNMRDDEMDLFGMLNPSDLVRWYQRLTVDQREEFDRLYRLHELTGTAHTEPSQTVGNKGEEIEVVYLGPPWDEWKEKTIHGHVLVNGHEKLKEKR